MCFDLHWMMSVLIWLVVIGAFIAVVRLLLPMILASLGATGTLVMQILNIIVCAAIVIAVIIFAFELLSCLMGSSWRVR